MTITQLLICIMPSLLALYWSFKITNGMVQSWTTDANFQHLLNDNKQLDKGL